MKKEENKNGARIKMGPGPIFRPHFYAIGLSIFKIVIKNANTGTVPTFFTCHCEERRRFLRFARNRLDNL
jgi:hypothetical protein